MAYQTTKMRSGKERGGEAAHPSREFRVGTILWDRYEITAVLGASKLGEIWRCSDRETGKDVAIRCLTPDLCRSRQMLAVIHAGIRRMSDKTDLHIAAVRQLVYVGDQVYLVGDYAPGMDIGRWIQEGADGKRSLEEALPVLRQAAEGLDFAHQQRIVHRNLKPSNIYLGPDGVARVTDFGLVPHSHISLVHGATIRSEASGPYLAPEVREGGDPDSASDQYALAALAWEMLSGAPPEPDADPPADLPAAARAALRRAMSKKPRNRFVTCLDFARAMGGERVGGHRGRSEAEKRRLRIWMITAASLLVLGTIASLGGRLFLKWLRTPAPPPPPPPPKESAPAREAQKPAPPTFALPEKLVATTPLPVEGQPWVAQTVPMEFVWVPAMRMWVGRFEVTNEEYLRMDPAHDSGDFRGLCLRGARQPVVRLNFNDAVAYAAWLTEQERAAGKLKGGWRYRLPSRMESILYTRAGNPQTYPWGEAWPPLRGNYADDSLGVAFSDLKSISGYQDGFAATAPVERSGENVWGLFGAGGNVWETTSKAAGSPEFGGWQGGGWDDYLPARVGCDVLYGFIGNARGAVNGFRLVLAPIADEAPPPPEAKPPSAPASDG